MNAALPTIAELAARAELRIGAQPAMPDQIPPASTYLPTAARRLELYLLNEPTKQVMTDTTSPWWTAPIRAT